MKALKWLALAGLALCISLGTAEKAQAQASTFTCVYVSGTVNNCQVVSATNPLPITGTFSTTGFPTTQTTGTPISVTTGGVTGTLPTGAVVVATNVGTTNAAYCKLGASATTSDQYIAPNGGWFAFTVGAATQLTCITSTSTTTVNMVGGSGLATGTGGGGGGGLTGSTSNASSAVATSSTNVPTVSYNYGYNGATWDQLQVSATKNLLVDTPTSSSNLYAAITAAVPCLNATTSTTNSYSTGQTNPANCDLHGNLYVQATLLPTTAGGMTTSFFQPAASDNHTNLKNGAGQVYWILAENNSATINYLRFYNAATGFNGCNSTSNLITQIQIPANTQVGGINIALPYPIPFSTGISYCVTSLYATNDTTAATASAMSITIGYN